MAKQKKEAKTNGIMDIINECMGMGLDTMIFDGEDAALQDDRIVLHSPNLNYIYGLL